MAHVPYSFECVPYSTEYVTRVTNTFCAIYGPTKLISINSSMIQDNHEVVMGKLVKYSKLSHIRVEIHSAINSYAGQHVND